MFLGILTLIKAPVAGGSLSGLSFAKRGSRMDVAGMPTEKKPQQGGMGQMGGQSQDSKKQEKKKRIQAQLKRAAEMRAMDKHNNDKVCISTTKPYS